MQPAVYDRPNKNYQPFVDLTMLNSIKVQTSQMQFDPSGNIKSMQQYPTGAVVTYGGNSGLNFKTNRVETTDNYWNGCFIKFTSGTNANQVKKVNFYYGTTSPGPGWFSMLSTFTNTPSVGDNFIIIDQ